MGLGLRRGEPLAPETVRAAVGRVGGRVAAVPEAEAARACQPDRTPAANSRIVSSMSNRGPLPISGNRRSRLRSTSADIPSSTSNSRFAPESATASAASRVNPPTKTASRRKKACSSGERRL
jgi:hypothetical protein